MKSRQSVCALVLLCSITSSVWSTGITFGSRESSFVVSGGTLALGSAAVLTEGTLRDTGGSISATSAVCSSMTLETKDGATVKRMTTDGTVTIGSGISLGNNQKLLVAGGTVAETLTAAGATATPSLLEGSGLFTADIVVSDTKQLNTRWSSPLNVNITLNASDGTSCLLKLEQDLMFGVGKRVVASDVSNATNTITFNGYRLLLGGDETTTTSISTAQTWSNANVGLTGPLSIAASKTVTLATSGAYFNGSGNALGFNTSSVLDNGGNAVTFDNIVLTGLTSASLAGSGDWTFISTRLEDSSNSITLDGSITSSTVNLFGGANTFGTSRISLNKDLAVGGTWTLGGAMTINGNGNVLNCGGSGKKFDLGSTTLRLEDVVLSEVVAATIDADTAATMYLSNVSWLGDSGNAIRVIGSGLVSTAEDAATLTLASSATAGNIFATSVSWANGVHMELLSDVALTASATWSFANNSILEGRGHHLDLASGTLSVASGKTLTLRNVVLDNVATGSLADVAGTLNLSNVTIILGGADVNWQALTVSVTVDGPLYIVTGSHALTVPYGGGSGTSTLNGVTAYYDTLSDVDNANVNGFGGTGRLCFVSVPVHGNISITSATNLTENQYLFPTDDGILGHTLTFVGTVTYNGHGRSVVFPASNPTLDSEVVFIVSNDTDVLTTNVLLEGLKPPHATVGTDSTLFFGDNTIVRLHEDWIGGNAPAIVYTFGSDAAATGETMVLDLNGYAIDLADAGAGIALQGGAGSTLRIQNGRLLNLSSTKLSATASSKLILENVELCLSVASSGNATFANAALDIEGQCIISGVAGNIFSNTSTDTITIADNATLTVMDGMIYSHNNTGLTNFAMNSSSSRLELIGGVFRRPASAAVAPLVLTKGTLVFDHKSYIQPGTDGINLGDGSSSVNNVSLEIRPGATINVTTDGSTTGTLTFANV